LRPNKHIKNRMDNTPRDPSDFAEFPPLLVRVSDGHSTELCQMPLEAALFLIRNRICSVVGDVTCAPTMVLEDGDVDEMFDAFTPRSVSA
jgi:hypothetical protein